MPDLACVDALRAAGVAFEPAEQPQGAEVACMVETPVRLQSFLEPTAKRVIALPDRPIVACRFAGPFTDWAGRIAAPVLGAARNSTLKAVRTGPGFQCRGRNRQDGSKMSAHGLGIAVDIMGFEFADGSALTIKANGRSPAEEAALGAIRRAACGWFTTVLGPGSDAYHDDHLHLDLVSRGSGDRYRICQ
jgi:hypothetical protein